MRFLLLFVLFSNIILPQSNTGIITGNITNSIDSSSLPNCNILIKESSLGTITDISGNFKISLPYGTYTLKISYVGYKSFEQEITLSPDNKVVSIKILLEPSAIQSKEVTVTGKKELPSSLLQEIKEEDLQKMPTIYNDVMRAVHILPGVISINEMSSGYNVRGGNFDDNLIYLNGFEIYRPFLLRQGTEENQTLINPDLTNELKFYNGSFPSSFGDKMSSALEVNYNLRDTDDISGKIRADLVNSGLTLKGNTGNLKIAAASRYAYPGLFLNGLQTSGDYKPRFADIQLITSYQVKPGSELEVFFLYAANNFDLTPTNWIGHFGGVARYDIRGLEIYYDGERSYSFKTGLLGLKYSSQITDNTQLEISAAGYSTIEDEKSNLTSDSYYLPDAGDTSYKEYLKSGLENVDNLLDLMSYELLPQIRVAQGNHLITTGLQLRLTKIKNKVNEQFTETGDSVVNDFPFDRLINQEFGLNSYSAFVQDNFSVNDNFHIIGGIRTTYYQYNKELLLSPRVNLSYFLSPIHNFTFSWGYYYQPPYYAELRNKENVSENKLKAQRAIHYSAGWEYQFKEKLKLNVEAYYKDLSNIIPYYIDREKTEYLNENSNEGYSYGFEIMVQGEIIEGMNSWLSYNFLNTKERKTGSGNDYQRRLTDNNHSVQIFLQDKIKKHPNWQSHLRLLFNTGYVYNIRRIITDEQGQRHIQVDIDKVMGYPGMYFRVDMGLSASFQIGNYNLVAVAEVLNLFDHRNFGSYRFVQVSKENNYPFPIPQILSSRFFNVGMEVRF